MKARLDQVTNSSSSSFLIEIPSEPATVKDVLDTALCFGNFSNTYDNQIGYVEDVLIKAAEEVLGTHPQDKIIERRVWEEKAEQLKETEAFDLFLNTDFVASLLSAIALIIDNPDTKFMICNEEDAEAYLGERES